MAEQEFEKGNEHYVKENWDEALKHFSRCGLLPFPPLFALPLPASSLSPPSSICYHFILSPFPTLHPPFPSIFHWSHLDLLGLRSWTLPRLNILSTRPRHCARSEI